jgi:hypothetical protein
MLEKLGQSDASRVINDEDGVLSAVEGVALASTLPQAYSHNSVIFAIAGATTADTQGPCRWRWAARCYECTVAAHAQPVVYVTVGRADCTYLWLCMTGCTCIRRFWLWSSCLVSVDQWLRCPISLHTLPKSSSSRVAFCRVQQGL